MRLSTACRQAAGGRPRPTIRFNGLFGGTSATMSPNIGIAMKMEDRKQHDLFELVDEA
jgi:hypothetical protein